MKPRITVRALIPIAVLVPALSLAIAGCDGMETPDLDELATEVTLLAVYTPAAATAAVDLGSYLNAAVSQTNVAFNNSGIDVALTLVQAVEVDYEATERLQDLLYLVGREDGVLDEVHALRDLYEADLVAFVVDSPGATINAAIMATPATGFVVVHWADAAAPAYGLAHEIGHLFGARHAPESDPLDEPFPYGHGFTNEAYRTIMANGLQERVPYFSGPEQVYDGVTLGDADRRDVARVIRETAVYIANFRGPQTPTSFVPPGTWPVVPADQ